MKEIRRLRKMGACKEALAWLATQPDWDTAWQTCQRGDWMLWLLQQPSQGLEHKVAVVMACRFARLGLPYVPKGEVRPLVAIETTEAWLRDEATIEQVRAAANAAAYAAANAAAYAAAYAAYAAANARIRALKECADIVRKHYPAPPKEEVR